MKKPGGIYLMVIPGMLMSIFLVWAGAMALNLFLMLVAIALIVLFVLIYQLRKWARVGVLILASLVFFADGLYGCAVFLFDPTHFSGEILIYFIPSTVWAVFALIYINLPRVKALFK